MNANVLALLTQPITMQTTSMRPVSASTLASSVNRRICAHPGVVGDDESWKRTAI